MMLHAHLTTGDITEIESQVTAVHSRYRFINQAKIRTSMMHGFFGEGTYYGERNIKLYTQFMPHGNFEKLSVHYHDALDRTSEAAPTGREKAIIKGGNDNVG